MSYVGKKAAVESTTILLAPTERLQADNPLTPALSNSLRKSGFALVESKTQASNAQVLRYQVSRLDDGVWVQLHLNQEEANRFYSLDASNRSCSGCPILCSRGEVRWHSIAQSIPPTKATASTLPIPKSKALIISDTSRRTTKTLFESEGSR